MTSSPRSSTEGRSEPVACSPSNPCAEFDDMHMLLFGNCYVLASRPERIESDRPHWPRFHLFGAPQRKAQR